MLVLCQPTTGTDQLILVLGKPTLDLCQLRQSRAEPTRKLEVWMAGALGIFGRCGVLYSVARSKRT